MQHNDWDSARLAIDPKREVRFGKRINKLMLEGREGSLNNYSLQLERCFTEVSHPRHTHSFEQIRMPIEGEFVYAKDKVLPAGWIGYFPAGVYYGPETRAPGTFMSVFQLGGASRQGYLSKEQREAAYDELVKKGEFDLKRGVFTWLDDKGQKHNKDAQEAVWEHAMQRDADYPKPRYNDIIVMNPENFAWEDGEAPGVARKWLGSFTEANTRVGFIRLDQGARLKVGGKADQQELLLLSKGAVNFQGRDYPLHSAFAFEAKEGPFEMKALESSEFLCVLPPQV